MKRGRAPAVSQGMTRRWHIPPALIHGTEPLEGGAVLAEVPGPLGLVLWQALRDVLLWSETPTGERADLFAANAPERRRETLATVGADASLAPVLPVFTGLLENAASVDAEAISAACGEVARWAEEAGTVATALAFAQDAALAAADEPAPALEVARLAVTRGDHARAEVWYRRAIGIARRARDWRLYTRAFSGLARLYQSRGNLPSAHRFHLRALRGARRGGLRVERAVALHDLFGVSVEAGRARDAERYAREAFAAYPPRHERIAVLAHDVAYFWMEQGHFARALGVFQAVAPLIDRPVERLWVDADVMRAAAGAGDTALARQAAEQVRQRCDRPEYAAAAPRAHLELARGELQLHEWEAAEQSAVAALRLATERRDGRTILTAESLLEAIAAARAADRPVLEATTKPIARGRRAGESLAKEMITTLREIISQPSPGGSEPGNEVTEPTVNDSKRMKARIG